MTKSLKKRITIGISIILLSFIMLALITNFLERKICEFILAKANNNLSAKFQVNKSSLNLFSNFPDLTISLDDVSIIGLNKFEGDTLIHIKSVDISLGISQVLNRDTYKFPEISKITCNDANIYINVLSDGTFNWNILNSKDSIATDNKNILSELRIHHLSLNHCSVLYNDKKLKTKVILTDWSGSFVNEYSEHSLIIKANSIITEISYIVGGIPYLSQVKSIANAIIDVDFDKNKYSIEESSFQLNDLKMVCDGSIEVRGNEELGFDLQLNTPNIRLKDILSLAYPIYTNDFEDLQSIGSVSFNGSLKGIMGNGKYPSFKLQLLIKDGMFKYPSLTKSVDDINIDMTFSNLGYIPDSAKIDVNRFDLSIGGNSIISSLHLATPQSDPNLRMQVQGDIDLSVIKDIYPFDKDTDLKGKIETNLYVSTSVSSIENKQYRDVDIKGEFKLDSLSFKSNNMSTLTINDLLVYFDPKSVSFSLLDLSIGESDIKVKGYFENIIPYLLKSKQLTGQLNIKSDTIQISDFFEKKSKQTSELSISSGLSNFNRYSIPSNINLQLITFFNTVVCKDLDISNIESFISIKDGQLDIDAMTVDAFGGKVGLKASYIPLLDDKKQEIRLSLNILNGSVTETLKYVKAKLNSADSINKISGNYSLDLSLKTYIGNRYEDLLAKLAGAGIFKSEELKIQKIDILDKLSSALKMDRLKTVFIKDLNIPFTIDNSLIKTESLNAAVDTKGELILSGFIGFDKSIDCKGSVCILETRNSSVIPITIKGTIKEPKIDVDAKGLISGLVR